MSAPVIDLDQVRQNRDAAIRLGRFMVQRYAESIGAAVRRWGERTDAAAAPIADTDAEAVRALAKWGARRLRAEVRRILADLDPDVQADTVAVAERGFTLMLIALADRRTAGGEGGQ